MAATVPPQYFYGEGARVASSGCATTIWPGTDPAGTAGWPAITKVECPRGTAHTLSGSNIAGAFKIVLWYGALAVNGGALDLPGAAYWLAAGEPMNLKTNASAPCGFFTVGAPFELQETEPAAFTTSFGSPHSRLYSPWDALAGRNAAANVHDLHIGNGTTAARDLIFSAALNASSSAVSASPPHIIVINCAPSANESYVWYHSHPQGALYLPLSGKLCFSGPRGRQCVTPGTARWTAPNFFYYEDFEREPPPPGAPWADGTARLAALSGLGGCDDPVSFVVTNFDPDHATAQPNFVDVPETTVPCGDAGGAKCPPPNRVGSFERLAVSTTVLQTVVIEARP